MESLAARSDGAMRWRWLGEAARLYSKDYRGDVGGPLAAQAAFRHAQVLGRLGRDGEARGAYLRATELALEPRLLARARLELAHAARRSGDRAGPSVSILRSFSTAAAQSTSLATPGNGEGRFNRNLLSQSLPRSAFGPGGLRAKPCGRNPRLRSPRLPVFGTRPAWNERKPCSASSGLRASRH